MKTIKFNPEIEDTLKELGVKDKVVKNMLKESGEFNSNEFQNIFKIAQEDGLKNFLVRAFIWKDTPEGHMYWQDLHLKLNGGKY